MLRKTASSFFVALVIVGAVASNAYAFESAKYAIQELCGHMTGSLGGLLMSAAGVGAIVAAAFGNFRASFSFLITGIGAFTVSAILSLYFPTAADTCDQGAGGNGANNGGVFRQANPAPDGGAGDGDDAGIF